MNDDAVQCSTKINLGIHNKTVVVSGRTKLNQVSATKYRQEKIKKNHHHSSSSSNCTKTTGAKCQPPSTQQPHHSTLAHEHPHPCLLSPCNQVIWCNMHAAFVGNQVHAIVRHERPCKVTPPCWHAPHDNKWSLKGCCNAGVVMLRTATHICDIKAQHCGHASAITPRCIHIHCVCVPSARCHVVLQLSVATGTMVSCGCQGMV